MNPISSLVFAFLLTVFPTQILCQTPLIESTCGSTIYKVLCLGTLVPDDEARSATDVTILAKVALRHTVDEASDVDTQIVKLKDLTAEGPLKVALSNCSDKYLTVVEKIQAAENSFAYGDVGGAKSWLNDATSNRNMCDEGFKGKPFKSPISDLTNKLGMMQNNAESIIAHM